jgi:hypothetical protein
MRIRPSYLTALVSTLGFSALVAKSRLCMAYVPGCCETMNINHCILCGRAVTDHECGMVRINLEGMSTHEPTK